MRTTSPTGMSPAAGGTKTLYLAANTLNEVVRCGTGTNNDYSKWNFTPISVPPQGAYLCTYDNIAGAYRVAVKDQSRCIMPGEARTMDNIKLKAVAYSPTTNSQTFTWSSSNTSVATVNSSTGKVTGVAPGKTTITGCVYRNGTYHYVNYDVHVGYSFEATMEKLEELYDVALAYDTSPTNAALLTLQFIRRMKYNNSSWNTVVGSINSQFVNYVENNYPTLYSYFTIDTTEEYDYLDPNGEGYVDFTHLCATLNGLIYDSDGFKAAIAGEANIDNLCGWAGDLQTDGQNKRYIIV